MTTAAAIGATADDLTTPAADNAAQAGEGDERTSAVFRGTAGAYFRIWLVNSLLTIITVGFYSPWAKVRNKRYFYGNAWMGDANFEYHANPLAILVARIVLLAMIGGGAYWVGTDDYRDAGYSLILAVVLPWAIARGLAFNARNSSWAGMRFSFKCDFLPIYLIYSPLLIFNGILFYALLADGLFWQRYPDEVWEIIWTVLNMLFVLLLPLFVRAYHCYKAGRHKLGNLRFGLHNPPVWGYYGALVVPFFCTMGVIALGTLVVVFLKDGRMEDEWLDNYFPFYALAILLLMIALFQFAQALLFRLFWNNLRARNDNFEARFVCDINILDFAFGILLVNALVTIISLGFLHPWAKVRKTNYLVRHIHIIAPAGALASLAAKEGNNPSALGEELEAAEGFDFDVGLI